ncbi:MAG: DUF4838 domain-containing protein [Ruminococcaceae bacterium]|nr:DUF4838 domain-containing protein [Oscillospiraceae bacterium]
MFTKIKPVLGNVSKQEKEPLLFAAKELSRYLRLTDMAGDFPVVPTETIKEGEQDTLFLTVGHAKLPQVEDTVLDDAVYICTDTLTGIISGTNARSVLIGAYRFLRENGFAFVKPGAGGEHIPCRFAGRRLLICEQASYRHRGYCMEGSNRQEDLMQFIDWLPKVGMNSYFFQFPQPNRFYNRYYDLERGYGKLETEEVAAMRKMVCDEMAKRGLLHHAVGHGWTCSALGIDSADLDAKPVVLSEAQREIIAEVGGKRDYFGGHPLNTQLCYSNPKARQAFIDAVLDYARNYPDVDFLHIWLADGGNNDCECEACIQKRTADHYVCLLNELDAALTKEGLNTRLVFLIYSSLVWPPVVERVNNPGRFTMMFAPFLRYYNKPLDPSLAIEMPPYRHNDQPPITKNIGEHLSYYREWKKVFDGDCFDFDYHFCEEFLFEMSGYGLSKIVHQDVRNFKALGLGGLIGCQTYRCFLPTALGMNVMAEALWNCEQSFETIADRVLSAQFGAFGPNVKTYLQALAELDCSPALHGFEPLLPREPVEDIFTKPYQEKMQKAIAVIRAFRAEFLPKTESMQGKLKHDFAGLLFFGEYQEAKYLYFLSDSDEEKKAIKERFKAYRKTRFTEFMSEIENNALNLTVNFPD